MIVPDVVKMGGIGGPASNAAQAYTPGPIGVISRSGGMTTEMSSTLSAAASASRPPSRSAATRSSARRTPSSCRCSTRTTDTHGIVIYTEPGGRMEAELATWVKDNDCTMPIVAFMAGRFMDDMPGMSFGHAGTIVEGKEDTASEKIARLAEAGITVAEEISEIPEIMKSKLPHVQHLPPPGVSIPEWVEEATMRTDAIFIGIEVDDAALAKHPGLPSHLSQVCPVDIYRETATAGSTSSPRTSTSACCAGCASTPRTSASPTAPSRSSSSTTAARCSSGRADPWQLRAHMLALTRRRLPRRAHAPGAAGSASR